MSDDWDGKTERRAVSAFERKVIAFMARVDQRNLDHDLQTEVRDEAAAAAEKATVVRFEKLEDRTISLETFRSNVKFALSAIAWVSGIAGAVYAGFAVLVRSVINKGG